jgi:hypothetical protein
MENANEFLAIREAMLQKKYNTDEIEIRILNGDGGTWIKVLLSIKKSQKCRRKFPTYFISITGEIKPIIRFISPMFLITLIASRDHISILLLLLTP